MAVSGWGVFSAFAGGGVEADVEARERRLYPRFDCAVVGAGVAAAGAAVVAAAVEEVVVEVVREEEGGGCEGARAARASASERWFANVFWDWRILRTAGVTLPCVAINHQYDSRPSSPASPRPAPSARLQKPK